MASTPCERRSNAFHVSSRAPAGSDSARTLIRLPPWWSITMSSSAPPASSPSHAAATSASSRGRPVAQYSGKQPKISRTLRSWEAPSMSTLTATIISAPSAPPTRGKLLRRWRRCLVRQMRHFEPSVTADEHPSGDRGGSEAVAHGIDRGVDRVLPAVGERQHELNGAVALEVRDRDADERQASRRDLGLGSREQCPRRRQDRERLRSRARQSVAARRAGEVTE